MCCMSQEDRELTRSNYLFLLLSKFAACKDSTLGTAIISHNFTTVVSRRAKGSSEFAETYSLDIPVNYFYKEAMGNNQIYKKCL